MDFGLFKWLSGAEIGHAYITRDGGSFVSHRSVYHRACGNHGDQVVAKQVIPMMRIKGFTLIEIAIVIVIIGLIIGSVIKGTSLISGAKVSNAITLAQDLSVAVNAFKQQYHMLPGDLLVTTELPNLRIECKSGSKKGNNNGLIDANESLCVPEVLFQAGLAKVDQEDGWYVFKSYYGLANVIATNQSHVGISNFAPSITHVVEFTNLPCEIVQEIDRKIDNDNITTGKGIASVATCITGSIVPYYAVAI